MTGSTGSDFYFHAPWSDAFGYAKSMNIFLAMSPCKFMADLLFSISTKSFPDLLPLMLQIIFPQLFYFAFFQTEPHLVIFCPYF